jgi:hypothetical protein
VKKNLVIVDGFINRHLVGVPEQICDIVINYIDTDGEHKVLCKWFPFNTKEYTANNKPGVGYLGTALRIAEPQIGFHAWEQNNSEFIYYKLV